MATNLKIAMVSGFSAKADGIAIYSEKLCRYLRDAGIDVEKVDVSQRQPKLPSMSRKVVHIQFGMQFFGGDWGFGIIPYIARLRLRGSRVVVTVHDVPAVAQPKRFPALLRARNTPSGSISLFVALGKMIIASIRVNSIFMGITLLSNVVIVHTMACQKALIGRTLVIPHGSDAVASGYKSRPYRTPLVLTFGIIHRTRRVDLVMQKLAALPLMYVIAGASKDPEFLLSLAKRKPPNAEVILTHPPLDKLIESAWIVVVAPSPNKPEAASGVLHVASSFGKPVLTPPTGEALEFPGAFVLYSTLAELETKAIELLANSSMREDFSDQAISFARITGFPRVAKAHARVYSYLAS